MRWLGFRSDFLDRSERHKGPDGPHPRAKIPEGKVESDFVSLGADFVTYSISSRYLCFARPRHMEFPGQAGSPQQAPHLVFFNH